MKVVLGISAAHAAISLATCLALQGTADAQSHPRISPDGRQVAHFSFDLDAGTADILITDIGTGETLAAPTGCEWSVNPAWVPDGNSIVFIGAPLGMADQWDVYEISLDDGVVAPLMQTPEREMHTQVSPDGSQIAFVRMTDGPDIWVLDRGHAEPRQLTRGTGRDFHPKWDEAGQVLVFDRTTDDLPTGIVRVATASGAEAELAAAPEGGRLRLADVGPSGVVYAIQSVGPHYALVELRGGDEGHIITRAEGTETFGAFDVHPDGASVLLSVTGEDGRGRLYQIELESGARTLVYE